MISEAEKIIEETKETFGNLSGEQLNWKPNANEWSIGQCFDHLITTNNLYYEPIQKVADGTHVNNWYSLVPLLPTLNGLILKKLVSPETARKMKTFKIFEPATSDISGTIIEDFSENQEKLISFMDTTKDLDWDKIKIPEPIGKAVNITLKDAFEVTILHERRHFNQAKRVLEAKEFPK